ncbi:DNA alkylation repair protein [Serinicoccus kebangsaanensis]|uniref:DNA alkylation repair protein n=1 Tax=Serinicoccus kebangsaanensis TaxID=2602069 RepID=UPI001EE364EE|nr:DNA alkylation repair protein [Serinicoccus kebangsaanensis]
MGYDVALVDELRAALAAAGDPGRAAGQQAYMKSALPFHGITSPELRRVVDPLLRAHPMPDRATWEATVRELWDGVTHREQWYAALALARHRTARDWQDPGTLPLYRHLTVTGAWWDVVDEIASRLVGPVLLGHRATVTPVMDDWSVGDDLWLRRVAILSQLRHRADTDTDLLGRTVTANLEGSRFGSEFFIRKAVGWALREHAKTDPAWVLALVDAHRDRLSGLSVREATKHL